MSLALVKPEDVRPTWQEVVLSFAPPEKRRTPRALKWINRVPLLLVLLVQTILSWRLSNIVSDDEGLYIDAGQDLIRHVLHQGPPTSYGTYLSGAPALYPVLAGFVDDIGGLMLVRLVSLVFMLVTTISVWSIGRKLFDRNTSLLAALLCSISGSVLWVGKYATYDALSVMLVVLALYVALCRRSLMSSTVIGFLLALAAATKYSALAEAPFILAIVAVGPAMRQRVNGARAGISLIVCAGLLGGAYREWGAPLKAGIAFTTTSRLIESFQPRFFLLRDLSRDLGIVAILALIGLGVTAKQREWRNVLVLGTLISAGLALPIDQIRIHEFVSFDKQTDFAGAFLALPAALGIRWAFAYRGWVKIGILGLGWLVLLSGLSESYQNYQWPTSIMKPLAAVRFNPVPGDYLTFDQGTVVYYTRSVPQVHWVAGFVLFGTNTQRAEVAAENRNINAAVKSRTYTGFLYTKGENSKAFDAHVDVLQSALAASPYYHLVGTWRLTPYQKFRWYLWQRTRTPLRDTATVSQPKALGTGPAKVMPLLSLDPRVTLLDPGRR